VWLKAKNRWVVNSQDIDLRDRRKYVTSQPSEAMIALELFLREIGFLEEVVEFRDLSLRHHGNTTSRRGESCHWGALRLRVTPTAFVDHKVDGSQVVGRPLIHGVQRGSSAVRMKIARKMGRQEREMMGWDVLGGASFIGAVSDRAMIRFPIKRCFSVSTAHAIQMRNWGAKRGKFKRFWSPRCPREGTAAQRTKSYQHVWHGHLPEVKRKFWHKCPIVLSTAVPDQHLSESNVQLEDIKK
jgi:hypothetical protein